VELELSCADLGDALPWRGVGVGAELTLNLELTMIWSAHEATSHFRRELFGRWHNQLLPLMSLAADSARDPNCKQAGHERH
jgi:hypothetical protein